MICSNCDFGSYPLLKNLIKPYVIRKVGAMTIGIIGFITTDTPVNLKDLTSYILIYNDYYKKSIRQMLYLYNILSMS